MHGSRRVSMGKAFLGTPDNEMEGALIMGLIWTALAVIGLIAVVIWVF
jgi:hypothetical protein